MVSLYVNDQQNALLKRVPKNEIPLFGTRGCVTYLIKTIEEDFGSFFKMDMMLLHIALGFVLIPLKPDVLKLVFDVHKTKDRLPYYSPPS